MKLLILGHGRHGKDTVAHFIAAMTGIGFKSSSEFACEKVVYPQMDYESTRDCYLDRHKHRTSWYNLIKDYNTPDKSRLCRELLSEYDMYVGMRDNEEYEASKHLFNHILWVDASSWKPIDTTMKISYDRSEMIFIDNNSTIDQLYKNVNYFINSLAHK